MLEELGDARRPGRNPVGHSSPISDDKGAFHAFQLMVWTATKTSWK